MHRVKKSKSVIGVVLVLLQMVLTVVAPLQTALAYDSDGAADVVRSAYFDLPEELEDYTTSGKAFEFDLNMKIASTDTLTVNFCYDKTRYGAVSSTFNLNGSSASPSITVTPIEDGWYHYSIPLSTVSLSDPDNVRPILYFHIAGLAIKSSDKQLKINNMSFAVDYRSLPEAFTEDYDTVTLADLGLAGTDYVTSVQSGTYKYNGKSKTYSAVIKFGWKANLTAGADKPAWKLALDTYWNEKCMVWFRGDGTYAFFPTEKPNIKFDAITSGTHDVEFGRLRVTAGPNYGKDYVFVKIDGEVKVSVYTDHYQNNGGYEYHSGQKTVPSYTVCFVDDTVSTQGFSGFAKPDEYAADTDYVNIGDIVPGGVVKDSIHDGFLGYTYPFSSRSKTNSTVVKYLLKTGDIENTEYDGSVYVVDIGGNCGFCRSYIQAGVATQIMFGWEIDGCTSGTKRYTFKGNSWYAMEQGRRRVISGVNKGKDYVYLKINGEIVSSFYGNPDSRPLLGQEIYVEATQNFQIMGYDEVRAKYYVDDALYLDQFAQKGYTTTKPADPQKAGSYFVGWYTQKEGGKLFDFANTKLSGNIDLYAHFTTETVKATFNPANGAPSTTVITGKNCLVPKQNIPSYSDGKYEYDFAGWKNETTGRLLDFDYERLSADTVFTAQYKEKEYYVSYYANGSLVKKVPFVLSDPKVSGKEPAVPEIKGTTGKWEDHKTSGLTKNITVNAVYTVKTPSASSAIKLSAYDGGKVYINTDTVHAYLSTDTDKQTAFVREFCASPHTYQDHQNVTFKWTDSGSNSSYTVYFADNKDFKNAYIVTTTKTSLVNEVGIFVPGKTYYWFVCGNNTGKNSAVDSFAIVNTPVRYITAGKVTNMRDEGGYMTTDGSKVKYGLVYRGASLDEYHSHIDDAARNVFNYLGMKSEIELRGGCDHDYTGWDENSSNVHYISADAYENMLLVNNEHKAQYKATFDAMADESNYPFYFHCSAGADRTGAFGLLLNGLLGVPYENLREDYELTSFSEIGLRSADGFSDGSFDNLKNLILQQYGDGSGNLQVAIEKYLTDFIGVSSQTLAKIKNIMLEKDADPNEKPHTITVDILGNKSTYQAFDGVYFMPEAPKAMGKLFKGFYSNGTKYNGYANSDLKLTAKFDDMQFEDYDTISLRDLGINENRILNHTNTVYTYNKTAKSGGRLFQFILEPIGNLNNNDGPQVALTNDWTINSYARAWFQSNTMSYVYYNGKENSGPDISKMLSLESGKQYDIQFAVRVMKNSGYEGKKVFEVTVNGELLVQYIGCKADLSQNLIFFHGSNGSAYLINKPVYKTVKFYNGNTLMGTYKVERSGLLPKVNEPSPKNGVPFAGWYTAPSGGTLWDENTDVIYNDMSLYAHFAQVKVITADVDGKLLTYRVEVGKTLDTIPKPKKPGYVFTGWMSGGKPFTGKVTSNMKVTAAFEAYSFDDYDEISLRDLGIFGNLYCEDFGAKNNETYTYYKAAKTGGRVFKAIYVPSENVINGPQISFSPKWDENYFAKLYFTKYDQLYVYSSGVDGGLPSLKLDYNLVGGKEYPFEIGVRVLNNKGYKGVKVLTVYLDGQLIFEEFDNGAPLDGDTVFFQGLPKSGYFKGIDIYKTVSFYNGNNLLSTVKVLRGSTVKSIGSLANKGNYLFAGWFDEYGKKWDFEVAGVYLDTVLKARFQKRTYPVLLMVDDVLYKRVNVSAGECIDLYDVPEKDGYDFDKWLREDGSDYDTSTPVNSPLKLIASFKKMSSKGNMVVDNDNLKSDTGNSNNNLIYIIFGIIGLIIIASEVILIVLKNKSKR